MQNLGQNLRVKSEVALGSGIVGEGIRHHLDPKDPKESPSL